MIVVGASFNCAKIAQVIRGIDNIAAVSRYLRALTMAAVISDP